MSSVVTIDGRQIGPDQPAFVIAEAGVNHNGDLERGLLLVDAASAAGADAVKFQTFKAENIVISSAVKVGYQARNTDTGESQFEMLRKLELSREDHERLMARCVQRDICFLSSPFDEESIELLDELGVPAFKVPSGEVVNTVYLRAVAKKNRPLIVSTGMATLEEIEEAIQAIEATQNRDVVLLHCTSDYPTPVEDANLRAMASLRKAFGYPVGYSDHTVGPEVALAAVALGASVLERHITLSRDLPGPDHRASLEPGELESMVASIRRVERALGSANKVPTDAERQNAINIRKSIVAARALPAGTLLESDMVTYKRPGSGMKPSTVHLILGRRLLRDAGIDEPLSPDMFE